MRRSCVHSMVWRIRGAVALVAMVVVVTTGGRADTPSSAQDGTASVASTPPAEGGSQKADFRTPRGAVAAFLVAAKAKDPVRLLEATALDATATADPKNQALFAAILNGSPSEDTLGQLASMLEGFVFISHGEQIFTGLVYVYIEKPGPNDTRLRLRIKTRKEKSGWKVRDVGRQYVRMGPTGPSPAPCPACSSSRR